MKRIPEEFIGKIKSVSIVEVAQQYFKLQRIGSVYQAQCIHGDRTPSLTFFENTNTFYCFGCQAGRKPITEGSDVISLVMWLDNCSFYEAVSKLASMQGWAVPSSGLSKEDMRKKRLLDELLETNRRYWAELQSNPKALSYLYERGISQEEIDKWRIGLVPMNEKYMPGRLAFPIMDHWGKTVGFSYRNMSDILGISDDKPKYINSPNSPVFDKGSVLYGLNFVKKEIHEKGYVIVGEGYADAIIGQKYGLPFISLMGTSLSKNQIQALKRHTDTVILWLDGDQGGISASIRHGRELMDHGFIVKIINIPGQDPDDVMLEFTPSEQYPRLENYILNNSYLAPFFEMDQILRRFDSDLLELKMRAIRQIQPIVEALPAESYNDPFLHYVARRLDMSLDYLLKGVKKNDNETNRPRDSWVDETRKLAVQS